MSVTVLVNSAQGSTEYDMFDLHSFGDESCGKNGAVLEGPLFLEVGEALTLRLAGDKGESAEVQAKVQSVEPSTQQMQVEFVDLDARLIALLKKSSGDKSSGDK